MKKILFVVAIAAITITSCKKDEQASPIKKQETQMAGGKTNMGEMD
jgi:hypothetical protein